MYTPGQQDTISNFHSLFYNLSSNGQAWGPTHGVHNRITYRGIPTSKCPLDLWIYQEIIHELRPSSIVELGTYKGGSTLFIADQLQLAGNGFIVSVDRDLYDRPEHGLIAYLQGDTGDPALADNIRLNIGFQGQVDIVIHDADHSRYAVLRDILLWADHIRPDGYLIVEDTNYNGHPVIPESGPGPKEAVEEFLRLRPDFQVDRSREKFHLSFNIGGYLRKIEP